jgi:hypothetical protein
MRSLGTVLVVALAVGAVFGISRSLAREATPVSDGGAMTLTVVEHNLNESRLDLGEPGSSPGDLNVWGPNPLYDEANAVDTGAVTQGFCHMLNAAGDIVCLETMIFPDGSTLSAQGFYPGNGDPSTTTITGGSGRFLHASGRLIVMHSEDRSRWTKTIEVWT